LENFLKNYNEFLNSVNDNGFTEISSLFLDRGLKHHFSAILEKEKDILGFESVIDLLLKAGLSPAETCFECRMILNLLVSGFLNIEKPLIDLNINNDIETKENYLIYENYDNSYKDYIKNIKYNEFLFLNNKLSLICKQYLPEDENYLELDKFNFNNLRIDVLQNKIQYLQNWLKNINEYVEISLPNVSNLKSLDNLTEKIKKNGFITLLYKDKKEFFVLNQEIENLKIVAPAISLKSLEDLSVSLKNLEQNFQALLDRFAHASKAIINSDIYEN
jgi:hypothetical protein